MEKIELSVPVDSQHLRLDLYLAKELTTTFSRTKLKQLIDGGRILLNGKTVKPHTKITPGDFIEVAFEKEPADMLRAESIPIDVVHEDEDIIVVNKPAGMVVHPGCGNLRGTLVNALLHHTNSLSTSEDPVRPGIVHRLDKDTSGILVIAKNDIAHRFLGNLFKKHEVNRHYWVVVSGVVQHEEMRCTEPLGKSVMNRKKVVVKHVDGKHAITNFKVLKRFQKATLLEARPETGRTHQIRVHLKTLGYPVLGDSIYGIASPLIGRQALHAKGLGFLHPSTKKPVFYDSEVPADMKSLLKNLEV